MRNTPVLACAAVVILLTGCPGDPPGGAPDVTPPAEVTGLSGGVGDQSLTVEWSDPTTEDLDHIEISWDPGNTSVQPRDVATGVETCTIDELINGTHYSVVLRTVDTSGNSSDGTSITLTPADSTPPGDVSAFVAASGDTTVALSWTDPVAADLAGIELTWSPPDGETQPKNVDPGVRSAVVTGLTNGVNYTFTACALDTAGNRSSGVTDDAQPADTTEPGQVEDLTASEGENQVTLSWTDPGDADLDHLEVTWTPAHGESQPKSVGAGAETTTVAGLTNGTIYEFSVTAHDGAGNQSAVVTVSAEPNPPAVTLLSEDFANWPPFSFSIVDGGDIGVTWGQCNSCGQTLNGATGPFAYVDSDAAGTSAVFDDSLVSPALDFTGFTDIELSFVHFYEDYSGNDFGYVEYSTDGTSFSSLAAYTEDSVNGEAVSLDLGTLAGQSTVWIQFRYVSGWDYRWLIDTVEITAR